MGGLRCQLFTRLLQVGRIELRKIARDALLQLCAASLHLPTREVLVASIDGLELTPIDRNESGVPRVPGTAVFLTRFANTIPFLVTEHVAQMRALYEIVIALTVKF